MRKPAILKDWRKIRLEGKKVFLRPMRKSDVHRVFELVNDRRVTRFLSSVEAPVSLQQEKEFAAKCENDWKRNRAFNFAICEKQSDLLVGGCGLSSFDKRDQRTTAGIWLGKNYWGKGFGFEAIFLLFQFGFEKLGLNRIQYGYLTDNKRSKGIAKKLGAKKEGVQREYCFKRGRFFDHAITSILASEWKKKWAKR